MVSPYESAAASLAAGDPLAALSQLGHVQSPEAFALCGCAFAQMGDLERAKRLLTRATRAFGARAPLARARCATAIAEISLGARELSVSTVGLRQAVAVLREHGDYVNALHAQLVLARTLLVSGRRTEAEATLAEVTWARAPDVSIATAELIAAELALRRVDVSAARASLRRAHKAARRSGIAALEREIARTQAALLAPAARLIASGATRVLTLLELERVLARATWLVDGCRRELRTSARRVDLSRKPVLLELLSCLAEAWPNVATREDLIARGFGARRVNDSQRARLRVELGRLRRQLAGLGSIQADATGFRLIAAGSGGQGVQVLLPPVDGANAALLALLGDGERWSSSALALALGTSQRTLQRALLELEQNGRVCSQGRGRAQRWSAAPAWALEPQLIGLLAQ